MGTTLDALNAGSVAYKYVVAIEGYRHLLTNATPLQAQLAWGDTDWSNGGVPLAGLFVDLELKQEINPWNAFASGAGSCMLRVVQTTDDDTFGVDTHRRLPDAETELTATIDRDDTTIAVQSTTGFPAGTFNNFTFGYCGTECFRYTGQTATTFTAERGWFSPFRNGAGGHRFAQHHRVGTLGDGPRLTPLVTTGKQNWIGSWVGVWIHREVDGVLDTKAEAHLAFAGRLVAIQIDAATGATCVELNSALDELREAACGNEMWAAKVSGGLELVAGMRFIFRDYNGSTDTTAAPLDVIPFASTPTPPYQIRAGYYTHAEIHAALKTWFDNFACTGIYRIGEGPTSGSGGENRTKIYWKFAGSSSNCWWKFVMPIEVAAFLGFHENGRMTGNGYEIRDEGGSLDTGGLEHHYVSNQAPALNIAGRVDPSGGDGGATLYTEFLDETGTFVDQYDTLPPNIKPASDEGESWGVFAVGDELFFLGKKFATGNRLELRAQLSTLGSSFAASARTAVGRELTIRQVYVIYGPLIDVTAWLLFSTGTPGHNGAHDTLGHGMGIAMPGELLIRWVASLATVPGADAGQLVLIDEPKRFSDLFGGDLVLRGAFPRWKTGSLELSTWRPPTTGAAIATLGEDTKAAPLGTMDNHRTASLESDDWTYNIVKVRYNRDAADKSGNGKYKSTTSLEDKAAIDNAGGMRRPWTVNCQNTYDQFADQVEAIEQLLPYMLARLPMFSNAVRRYTRSIDPRWYFSLTVGDVVTVVDGYARDPDTGIRAITTRPALIVMHFATPGGATLGSNGANPEPNPMSGEILLLLLDQDRSASYVPAALVDQTQPNGGYDDTTKVLACHPHAYSLVTEPADASWFGANRRIRIVEIDPLDPDAPLTWDVTVASQAGDTITHLGTALAGWDATKRYRIIWDEYADVVPEQRAFCYQASAVDGRIVDVASARQYSIGNGNPAAPAADAADPIELPPRLAYGDGRGRDVAHDLALARLSNALVDRWMAHSSPYLSASVMSKVTGGGTWQLVQLSPIWLTDENYSGGQVRFLYVAPFFRSKGGTARVRVTIARTKPTGSTFIDVNRGTAIASHVFSKTATTWGVSSTAAPLPLAAVKQNGWCWLLVEVDANAETYGLARCVEGSRLPASSGGVGGGIVGGDLA